MHSDQWVQCEIRLLIRFQIEHGLPLLGDPNHLIPEPLTLDHVLDSPLASAVREATRLVTGDGEFTAQAAELEAELDHLSPDHARRIALNETLDRHWHGLRREIEIRLQPASPAIRPRRCENHRDDAA